MTLYDDKWTATNPRDELALASGDVVAMMAAHQSLADYSDDD